jgi:putative ATP-dependent endonuclease of the OLD family
MGLASLDKLTNVSVIDGNTDYEGYLIAEGYLDAVESAINAMIRPGCLDRYIAKLDGKDGKKSKRDYHSPGGRERAATDLLRERKTRVATAVATAIVSLSDETRRIPPAIRKLFDKISEDLKEA